ncbi:synaptojanin-2-binding protein-like [Haliotis rubra]|uniref:synaptojanin-2-binding protein-like n=1 Tax=Haliotis rubra TaxID=36100 RepID=UPI001EE5E0EC|nr:synaptojanin-2-binding protein-like [Haliotis rubra]
MSLDLPVTDIILLRGDTGLGFNIRGGVDIPHLPGDPGIFVTKLKENGAAYQDGRLKEGDKILEINGNRVERVSHQEAVQTFLNAGNEVRLKVQCGAEKHILQKIEERKKQQANSSSISPSSRKSKFSVFYFLLGVGSAIGIAYFAYRKLKGIRGTS